MMITLPYQETQQDSTRGQNSPIRDSVRLKSDSVSVSVIIQPKDSLRHRVKTSVIIPVAEITDTTTVCRRNSIVDVTFYEFNNLITRIERGNGNKFPFLFLEKNRQINEKAKTSLVKLLKVGDEIPYRPLHTDWITLIILLTAFLYAIIRKSSDNMIQGLERFFLFRGVNNPPARDIGGLFTWESTIKNLTSFFILGLFGYCAGSYHNIIPPPIGGIIFWLISVGIIITAITLRHMLCLVTGAVSGEREVFTEYMLGIYQFYRFSALLIFVVTILISYTTIFSVKSCFIAGVTILLTLYVIRVIRLLMIFINKNISLFYLILYLCALEILPVVISVKYISGLA